MVAMSVMQRAKVTQKYVPLLPLLISILVSTLLMGMKAPLMHIGEDGLCHLCQRALQQVEYLAVPLVGLVVVTHLVLGEMATQQDVHHVGVETFQDGCCQQFATELKHVSDGTKIQMQGRAPRREIP